MKKITFILSALFLTVFLSCDTESINEEPEQVVNSNPNFRVVSTSGKGMFSRASYDEPCMTTNLIAGQNYIAGTVSVDNDGENLIITYSTNGDWTIDLTHLSIGGCEDQWVPTTGSGNPKIGQFEHSEPHADGTTEVVYLISLDALTENYCFAAHAEVQGSTGGETAWAEGPGFDGNSWAMYVEALLSDCDVAAADEEEEPPVK